MNPTYNTKRLTLKKLIVDDATFILELANTSGWIQFSGVAGKFSHACFSPTGQHTVKSLRINVPCYTKQCRDHGICCTNL